MYVRPYFAPLITGVPAKVNNPESQSPLNLLWPRRLRRHLHCNLTSTECEGLFLDEKFAIGQMFRHMKVSPKFALLNVHTRNVKGRSELERTYQLEAEGVSCEITEVFPDRDMFVLDQAWLDGYQSNNTQHAGLVVEQPKKVDGSVPVTVHGLSALIVLSFIFGSYSLKQAGLC